MKTTLLSISVIIFGIFLFTGLASASPITAEMLQPANATTNFGSIRVGVAGQGGVTFFNGSVLNEDGPYVIADDSRIDGEIWRMEKGGDNPVKISDHVIPTMTNINNFGTASNRWNSVYAQTGNFSGDVQVGNLQGSDVIHPNNLSASNSPLSGQVLSYDGNNFQWTTVHTGATDRYADSWSATGTGNTDRNITIGVVNGSNVTGTISIQDADSNATNEIQNIIANQGLRRDANNNFGLINTCSGSQILEWNGSSWVCGNKGGSGYWSRSGTNLSPAASGDDIYMGTNELLGVGYNPTAISGAVAAFNGDVGIGTSTPNASASLEIAGNLMVDNYIYFNNVTSEYLRYNGADFIMTNPLRPSTNDAYDLGSNTYRWRDLYLGPSTLHIGSSGDETQLTYNTGSNLLTLQNSADSTTGFQFLDAGGGTPILNIDTTNERVGIGTASPGTALEVQQTANSDVVDILASNTGFSNTIFRLATNEESSTGTFYFTEFIEDNDGSPTQQFAVEDNGEILTKEGLNIDSGVLTISSDPIITSGSSLGIDLGGSSGHDLRVDNNALVVESDTNEVGIGTTDPNQALDVEGLVGLQHTNSPGTCNLTNEGAIYYDQNMNEPCFCNATNWWQFDGGGDCT